MFFRRRGKAVNIVTMCCNAHKAERHERKLILPIVSVQNWLKKHGTEALEKNGFFGFVVEGRFLTQQMSRKIDVCKLLHGTCVYLGCEILLQKHVALKTV